MSASGALFDLKKLDDVSKNTIAMMSASKVCDTVIAWSEKFDPKLCSLLKADRSFSEAIFAIGRDPVKPRKDLASWDGVKDYAGFFFDELYEITEELGENVAEGDEDIILRSFLESFDPKDDQTLWFEEITAIAVANGYAAKPKEYKKNPEAFKGHVGDVSSVIRLALSGKKNSPDMYAVMQVLGEAKVRARLEAAIGKLR
jgi:glutamyl-tRNA synthetase